MKIWPRGTEKMWASQVKSMAVGRLKQEGNAGLRGPKARRPSEISCGGLDCERMHTTVVKKVERECGVKSLQL